MQRIADQPIQNQLKTIDAANKFGIDELTVRIIDLIREQINCNTCIPVFVYAYTANNSQLMNIVEPFILQNLKELVDSQRDLVVEMDQKFELLKRLTTYLIKSFRQIYENPQTLQIFSVQKF
jgi:hypothetical protein